MSYSVIFLSNIAELKSRRGNNITNLLATINGVNYPLDEAFAVYQWQDDSTATTDDFQTVGSLLGDPNVGRWLRVDNAQMPQINADYNATSGPAFIFNKPDLTVYALTSALSAYATNSAVSSALSSYVSQTSLSSILNSYVQTSALSSYVTSSNLSTTLAGYATNSSLSNYATITSLSNYALTSALSAYATNTSLSAKYNTPTGTTLQYVRGDGSLAAFPTLFSGSYSDLTNKPTLFDGTYASLTGTPTTVSTSGITDAVSSSSLASTLGGYATTTALATKLTTPSGNTSQYIRGDGSLATFPTIQAIQRVRATTSALGAYTWTFPVAYASGTLPVISLTVEDGTTAQFMHQITSLTNTAVTVQLTRVTSVTIATISVLGLQSAAATVVHLFAVAP